MKVHRLSLLDDRGIPANDLSAEVFTLVISSLHIKRSQFRRALVSPEVSITDAPQGTYPEDHEKVRARMHSTE